MADARFPQSCRRHSLTVAFYRNETDAHETGRFNQIAVSEFVHGERVADIEKSEHYRNKRAVDAGKHNRLARLHPAAKARYPESSGRSVTSRSRAFAVRKKAARIIASHNVARGLNKKARAQFRKSLDCAQIDNRMIFAIRSPGYRRNEGTAPRNTVNETAFAADVVCARDGGEIHV